MSETGKNMSETTFRLPERPNYNAWCAPGFHSAYYTVDRRYQIMRSHGLPTAYLTFTLSGNGFFRDRLDQMRKLSPGDLCLLEPHHYQNYGAWPQKELWRFHWVHLHIPLAWANWIQAIPASSVSGLRVLNLRTDPLISQIFFTLHPEKEKNFIVNEPLEEALAMNAVEKILLMSLQHYRLRPTHLDARVDKVLEIIQAQPYHLPSMESLVQASDLSESRLRHLFKSQTSTSLTAAINQWRFQESKRALSDPKSTLEAAAESLGFSNQFSFSKWFLKHSGQRPSSYRRKVIYYAGKSVDLARLGTAQHKKAPDV